MPFSTRLTLAREAGLAVPDGPILVFGATPDSDLDGLPEAVIVSKDARVHARWPGAVSDPPENAAGAVVLLPREKARARAELARAAAATDGPLIVDGQKTDGIEPMYKALKAQASVSGPIAKAHGKLFWCETPPDLSAWQASPIDVDGLRSWPGVFSANKVDAGSALLAKSLPERLGRSVCDLGAGWGWLSAQIAERVEELHMVETDGWALDCACINVPSATAHWADVTRWETPRLFDTVVMNPPFHEGRKGVPDLGLAFIAKAAEILAPTGQLFMVANRHLPYEATLTERFRSVVPMDGDGMFKLFHASAPGRAKAVRAVTRRRR